MVSLAGFLAWAKSMRRHVSPVEAPPPPNELRKCRGCGVVYHKSWGAICPDCSGAD